MTPHGFPSKSSNRRGFRRFSGAILLGGLLILIYGCSGGAPGETLNEGDHGVAADPASPQPDPANKLDVEQSEKMDAAEVSGKISQVKQGKKGKALHTNLDSRGFKPGTDAKKDFFGQRVRYKHPDRPNVKITHTFVLQNYGKAGSKDAGAVASVTLTVQGPSGTESTTYDFALIAPEGNFENPTELTANEAGTVTVAHSWYSCVTNRIKNTCGTACIGATVTCLPSLSASWVAYLGCLAVSCGTCLTKAVACCTCNCSWTCKWAVGCCSR